MAITTLLCYGAFAQELSINISKLRNNKGTIILDVYNNKETFKKEQPLRTYIYNKDKVQDGHLQLIITDLEAGKYSIALVDDENSNHKIDYKFLVPSEGFAFSNFPFRERRKPDFESFSFDLSKTGTTVNFEVFYFQK